MSVRCLARRCIASAVQLNRVISSCKVRSAASGVNRCSVLSVTRCTFASSSQHAVSDVTQDSQDSQWSSPTAGRYCIVFTCRVCQSRSSKSFSKQAYSHGVVIVRCAGCDSLHLIADNLGWFKHVQHRNVEEMLKAKGESVKRFVNTEDGTVEVTNDEDT